MKLEPSTKTVPYGSQALATSPFQQQRIPRKQQMPTMARMYLAWYSALTGTVKRIQCIAVGHNMDARAPATARSYSTTKPKKRIHHTTIPAQRTLVYESYTTVTHAPPFSPTITRMGGTTKYPHSAIRLRQIHSRLSQHYAGHHTIAAYQLTPHLAGYVPAHALRSNITPRERHTTHCARNSTFRERDVGAHNTPCRFQDHGGGHNRPR